ncbi:hypothetical protein B0H34DRAFT_737357 [Crassisporium funariophilum]|nr:hypothetical protein B0H34DRAFT_737357 [Crassisporium funariophilum]
MLALSPELCGRIVQVASDRRPDLLALCLTCKAFQREAEIRIYSQMAVPDPQRALLACNTVINNERLALLVRSFLFNQPIRRPPTNLGRQFWSVIQNGLVAMSNIEVLLLCDNSYLNTWIFDHPGIQFQLKEAKLRFAWDAYLVRFLETQPSLCTLHLYDSLEEVLTSTIGHNALPNLRIFDGTLMIGFQFLPSRITHLQLVIDTDSEQTLALVSRFGILRKNLRGLSLIDFPEETSLKTLDIISQILPELRHVGLFPYPVTNVSNISFL